MASDQYTANINGLQAGATELGGLAGRAQSTVSDLGRLVVNALSFAQIGSGVGAANASLHGGLVQALGKVSSLLAEIGQLVGVSGQGYQSADSTVARSLGAGGAARPTTAQPGAGADPAGWHAHYTSPNPHPAVVGHTTRHGHRIPTYDMTGHEPPATAPAGNLDSWITDAKTVLRANGVDTSSMTDADLRSLISHESGGHWDSLNNWDSNARHGIPSKGLMQTVDQTFNSYSVPGHRDVWNPVDNIVAGVRYGIKQYGSFARIPGIQSLHSGGQYRGY